MMLIAFCVTIFPSWGLNCLYIPKAIGRNEFEIAPLKLFGEFAFSLILPLGVLGLIMAFLPSWLIRCACVVGTVACITMFMHFLLPHAWRISPLPDAFYNTLWEKAKKDANEGNNYEHIEFDAKTNNQIIFYVKGFGISGGEFFYTLFCYIPSVAFGVEILIRRKLSHTAQSNKIGLTS